MEEFNAENFLNTSRLLRQISHSDSLSSVGSSVGGIGGSSGNFENRVNNNIINELDSGVADINSTIINNNSSNSNNVLSIQQQQQLQQLQQQHKQQYEFDAGYTPPNVYIFDPGHNLETTSTTNSNNNTITKITMIPENEIENSKLKNEILKQLSHSEIFNKIKEKYDPIGEVYGYCECTLLYNHLTICNLVTTENYLIFLPQHQPMQDKQKEYILENYLHKKGDFFWKKYWFVLTTDSISWYKSSVLKETHYPNGTILLNKIVTVDRMDPEETGKPFCLQIMTNTQIHLIQLDTEPQLEHWYTEVNRMKNNLHVVISFQDIISISMESNAALFFDSLCLTLKRGENCLVTPTSSSNEIYNLLLKCWNKKRGLVVTDSEKQLKLLEFQKTFKLSQGVDILTETQCTFYQDEEFSYDGILYATRDTLYFSSQDSVLIIPESDIYAITIDRKSDNRDALKVYTTDFDVIFFDNIEDVESFFNTISNTLANSNPNIFFSTVGQIPPIEEPVKESTSSKSTISTISSGIKSWKIPLPNFSIPIPSLPKSIPIPLFRSKSTNNIDSPTTTGNSSNTLEVAVNQQQLSLPTHSPPNSTTPPIVSSTSSQQHVEKTILIQKNSSINSTFHDIFPLLPLDETVIMFQNCTLYYYSYDSNVEGTVYVTKSFIAFNPSPISNQHSNQHPTSASTSSSTNNYDTDSDTDSEDEFDNENNNNNFPSINQPSSTSTTSNYKIKDILMKKALIPFEDIVSITKERFALFFNQCVKIVTLDHKWIFGSLNNFIGFYNLILETWKIVVPKTPITTSGGITGNQNSSTGSTTNINYNNVHGGGNIEEGSIFTPLESVKIKNKLGLPSEENLITWFNCTNFKGAQLKYGFLYISNNNICFRSKFGFQKRTIVIPLSLVTDIKKYSVFIPNGIKITTASHHEFQFASFIHRNRVYQILYDTWQKYRKSAVNKQPFSDIQEVIDQDEEQQQIESKDSTKDSSSGSGITVEKLRKSIKSLPILTSQKLNSPQQQQQVTVTSPRGLPPPMTISQSPGFSSLVNSPVLPVKPLRITILTIGSRGDIQPFIALALGLKDYGHNVTLCSHELYRDLISKDYNLNYQPLGGDPKELMDLCVRNGIFTPKFIKEALSRFRSFIDDLLLTCWQAAKQSQAQVLIATPGCFAGPHIAEALQIPFFNAFTMPFTRTRTYPNPFAPFSSHQMGGVFNLATHVMMEKILWQPISGQINQWRTDTLKITPWNSSVSINETYRMPYLYCFSKYLVPKPPDWSGEIDITGYWLLKGSSSDEPPESLLNFLNDRSTTSEPPIYIGFGSIVIDNPTALSLLLVEAIKLSGKRAIISQGWGGLSVDETAEEQGTKSSIYLLKQPVDHSWLFEKVSLVIHHGGAGTTAAGILANRPTIVIPFFGDQFFWGERIKSSGIGTSITPDTLSAKSLASHILSLINEPSVRAKLSKMSHHLKKEDGVGEAIDFIHRYLPVSFIPPREIPFSTSPNSCMGCKKSFTLLHVMSTRVHCHACGQIFCEQCATHKIPIKKYRMNSPVRVCNQCFNDLSKEQNNFILSD